VCGKSRGSTCVWRERMKRRYARRESMLDEISLLCNLPARYLVNVYSRTFTHTHRHTHIDSRRVYTSIHIGRREYVAVQP